jgi:general secretion pathway protein F
MPRYRYRAYDSAGVLKSGEVEALSDSFVLDQLRAGGLLPVEAVEQRGSATQTQWWERDLFAGRALAPASLALFTRELATLVEADVPLDEALRIVAMQPMSSAVRKVTEETLAHLLEGASLAEAMERQGRFGDFYCSMVRAGEASGNLTEVLRQLASFLERSVETRARIRSALIYPSVLVMMAIGALVLIATVLLPTIVPIFKDAGAEPPFIIQKILDGQAALARHWIALCVILALAAAGLVALSQNQQARAKGHRLLLRTPVLGHLVTMTETAKLARTLASLLGSGVPMLTALRIVESVAGNAAFTSALATTAEEVKEGRMLSQALRKGGVFPSLMLRLIAVGEETGRLEPMLRHVEKIFETQLQRRIEQILTLMTPALTILMGLIVGGLIMSVMSAILSINELALK